MYIPIFGLRVRPFFEVSSWCSNGIQPIHACSSNPSDIRKECEHLKANLLDRLRQIFFTASINTYYGSFIPCCFSQVLFILKQFTTQCIEISLIFRQNWCMIGGGISSLGLSFLLEALFFLLLIWFLCATVISCIELFCIQAFGNGLIMTGTWL